MKKYFLISMLSLVLFANVCVDVFAMQSNGDGNAMYGDKSGKNGNNRKKRKREEKEDKKSTENLGAEKKKNQERRRRKESKECEICHTERDGESVGAFLACFKQNPETEENKKHFVHATCLQSYIQGKKEFIAQHRTPVVGWHYAPCPAHVGHTENLCDGQLHIEDNSEQIVPACSVCRLSEEDSARLGQMPNEKFEDLCLCCGCKGTVHFSCLIRWIDQLIKRGSEVCCFSVQCRAITDWAQRMKLAQQVIGRIEKVLGGQGPEKEMMRAYLQDIIFDKAKEMSGAAGFLLYAYYVSGGVLNTQLTAFFKDLGCDKRSFAMDGLFEYVGKRLNNGDLRPLLFLKKEQLEIYNDFLNHYSCDQVRIFDALRFALEGKNQEIIDFLMGNEAIKNAIVNHCEREVEQASDLLLNALLVENAAVVDFLMANAKIKIALAKFYEGHGHQASVVFGAALCIENAAIVDFMINNETIKRAIATYLESNGQLAAAILSDAFSVKKLELVDFLMRNQKIVSVMADYLEDDGEIASDILRFALYYNKTEIVSLLMRERTKLKMIDYCKHDADRALQLLNYAIFAGNAVVVDLLIKSSISFALNDLETACQKAERIQDLEKRNQVKTLIQGRIRSMQTCKPIQGEES